MSAEVSGNIYGICEPIEKLNEMNKQIFPVLDRLRVSPHYSK
jgi:hypothetical protein